MKNLIRNRNTNSFPRMRGGIETHPMLRNNQVAREIFGMQNRSLPSMSGRVMEGAYIKTKRALDERGVNRIYKKWG